MSDVEEDIAVKRVKIVLVGDLGSGKTSIAVKFCNNEYSRQYTPTAGIDFFFKSISVGSYKSVHLHIWDVSGLALNGNMLDKYLFEARIVMLVYDVTNSSSFDILEEWMNRIKDLDKNNENEIPLMAVIGNKCDMEHQRTVKKDRSHRFAAENGLLYHDISARTGESVSLCIANLVAQVLGLRLTKVDQDFHKPIIIAEIGDSVDVPTARKVVKRLPNKKHSQLLTHHLPSSKSKVCSLQ